ncbi:hypothetical protein B224_2683 [Aeromonas media WS]|nr:hypothetical protein B224_2683 [Aeromonas media WS]
MIFKSLYLLHQKRHWQCTFEAAVHDELQVDNPLRGIFCYLFHL